MTALFTVEQVLAAVKRQMVKLPAEAKGREHAVVSVAIDSRQVEQDALFIPLAGARVDGHEFIGEAVSKGAGIVLVAGHKWPELEARCLGWAAQYGVIFIQVGNTLDALQDLAFYHINRFPGLIRIGVTGSSGKTTTKEIIGRILSLAGETAVNEGNLNSDMGLPLAVFKVKQSHRYAIFEMGMSYPGEMDMLARLVKPHFALITNIGKAHLEQLGSQEGIAREKKKIFKYFDGSGKGFIFEDERYYTLLSEGVKGLIIPYGPRATKGYKGATDLGLEGTTLYWEELQIRFPLLGQHNLRNALGAIALTSEMGVDKQAVKSGLESVSPLFGRSQVYREEITIIKDYYNANPDSMTAALDFLQTLAWQGRKIPVLGSMLELGMLSGQAHQQVGEQILTLGVETVFLFGKEMGAAYEVLAREGKQLGCFWTEDFNSLLEAIERTVKAGDLLLIKGSRGMQLERLVEPVTQRVKAVHSG